MTSKGPRCGGLNLSTHELSFEVWCINEYFYFAFPSMFISYFWFACACSIICCANYISFDRRNFCFNWLLISQRSEVHNWQRMKRGVPVDADFAFLIAITEANFKSRSIANFIHKGSQHRNQTPKLYSRLSVYSKSLRKLVNCPRFAFKHRVHSVLMSQIYANSCESK